MKQSWLAVGLLAVLVVAVSACTQQNASGGAKAAGSGTKITASNATQSPANLSPQELSDRMEREDIVLVNVHVPYAGQIPGTDLQIPFDQIDKNLDRLPADREAPIAVYCMSGRMSEIAADKLAELGYRRVLNLEGGMVAWDQAGFSLVDWQK